MIYCEKLLPFQFCNGSFNVGEFQNHLTVCMRSHGGGQQQQQQRDDQVSEVTQPFYLDNEKLYQITNDGSSEEIFS